LNWKILSNFQYHKKKIEIKNPAHASSAGINNTCSIKNSTFSLVIVAICKIENSGKCYGILP
jgi:hypothetical protein